MNANNQMHRMYAAMIKGYKTNQKNMLEHAVKCWMDMHPENPFDPESSAYEHFFRMTLNYNVWRMDSADKKIRWKRMIAAANDLCATNTRNPYKFDKKADEQDKLEAAEKERIRLEELQKKEALQKELESKEQEKTETIEEIESVEDFTKTETVKINSHNKEKENKHVLGVIPENKTKTNVFKKWFHKS